VILAQTPPADRHGVTRALANLGLIVLGAAALLVPAFVWGRPFIFYDTPIYWGWGRDIVEALHHPWPQTGQPWIPGRSLHGWELGAHGAAPGDLRFMLTAIEARSPYYAVPLYLLTAVGGLWLIAGLQALAAAWTLRVALRALAPELGPLAYLSIAVLLTAASSLGFEAGYIMPDIFGGLALLAAAVLVLHPDRVRWPVKAGLTALMAFAALVHTSNMLNLIAAAGFGVVVFWRSGPAASLRRGGPIAAALVVAFALASFSHALLTAAFGRAPMTAPFVASRVLADGVGQRYLQVVCRREKLAACDLAHVSADYPEYYLGLYPLEPPPAPADAERVYDGLQYRHVSDAEAAKREQFVAEQPQLVLGAARTDGPRLAAAMLANGAREVFYVAVERDFDSLSGLLAEHTQTRDEVLAMVPNAASCARGAGAGCTPLDLGLLVPLQKLVAWASLVLLVAARLGQRREERGAHAHLATLVIFMILVNAFLCGALAGPYDRYQSRVEWLVPLCALLQVLEWARQRNAATLRSPSASIVAEPSVGVRS
jgi:hypothetical protein